MTLKELLLTLDYNDSLIKTIGLYRPSTTTDHCSNQKVLLGGNIATPMEILKYEDAEVISWTVRIFDDNTQPCIRLMITLRCD